MGMDRTGSGLGASRWWRVFRRAARLTSFAVALGVGGLWAASAVGAATTFTVNSAGDQPDANLGDGVCATAVST